MPYYLHRKRWFGIHGDITEALDADPPISERLTPYDFEEEWQQ